MVAKCKETLDTGDKMTRDEINSIFAEGLRKFMRRKGLTYRGLAKAIGFSVTSVQWMRNGETSPTLEKVVKLMELGMTWEEVFGERFCSRHMPKVKVEEPAGMKAYDMVECGLLAMLEKVRSDKRNA